MEEITFCKVDILEFENEIRALFRSLVEDRDRLLAKLGMTEHDWRCAGGAWIPEEIDAIEMPSTWKDVPVEAQPPTAPPPPAEPLPEGWQSWPAVWIGNGLESVELAWLRRYGTELGELKALATTSSDTPKDGHVKMSLMPGNRVVVRSQIFPDEIREAPPPPPPTPPPVELPPPPPPAVATSKFEDLNDFMAAKRFVPPAPRSANFSWTEEQQRALDAVAEWIDGDEPYFALTGAAGTGKSTLVREIVNRHCYVGDEDRDWDSPKISCALTAMTGRAAIRLSDCVGKPATTFHKLFYWPPTGGDVVFTRVRNPEVKLVVIDEASLMTPNVFGDLSKWANKGVRFILVGDSYQLPPVVTGEEKERWGEDYSVFAQVRGTALETVMRSVGGVLRAATRVREKGEVCREPDFDASTQSGYEYLRVESPVRHAVEAYLADHDDHMLITWRNETRMQANKLIREKLGHSGPLPDAGEPVLIRKSGQGFMNGEIVTCVGFEPGPVLGSIQTMWMDCTTALGNDARVLVTVNGSKDGEFFDGGPAWVENYKKYHIDLKKSGLNDPVPVTFGYVITAHAAQGSEARRVTVFLGRGEERSPHFRKPTTLPSGVQVSHAARWVYTAMTRSKIRTSLVVGR